MFFYDSNSKIVEVSVAEKISHQYNSHYVYRTVDGRCLKIFRIFDVGPDFELEKKIQSLQLDNFFTVDEYLFDKNGDYSAFLMPFYEKCSDDILLKSCDYLSDNFNLIFSVFDKLACERIETRDANFENTIFTKDRIIIIDDERYCENFEDDMQFIRNSNYSSACWILYFTLIKAAVTCPEFDGVNFYNWFYSMRPDGIEMCRYISECKYPIEYLRKVRKRIK